MKHVVSIAAHGDPAQTALELERRERDRLTPRTHPLRSRTSMNRDQRCIGERIRQYYLTKYAARARTA